MAYNRKAILPHLRMTIFSIFSFAIYYLLLTACLPENL